MINSIKKYFLKTQNYSNLRYVLELTAVCFLAKILFIIVGGILLYYLGVNTETDKTLEEDLLNDGPVSMTLQVILFASIETVIGQWFILWLSSKFTQKSSYRIFASAAVFALLHRMPMLVVSVFPIGLILAYTFLIKRKNSLWEAFWVTTAIHVLHNLVVEWLIFKGVGS